jgi:hypothetical protein
MNKVHIKHYKRGRLVEERHEHNAWLLYGRTYLSKMVGYADPVALVTERNDRLKYMMLGVGGKSSDGTSYTSPIVDAYPAGSDPLATAGNEYDPGYPPMLTTMERPVRITGAQTPYPGSAGDIWTIAPPNLYLTHLDDRSVTMHATVDCSAGDVVYGTFTTMPITEAGLALSSYSTGAPYGPILAYVTFVTLMLDVDSTVEFIWTVRFGS